MAKRPSADREFASRPFVPVQQLLGSRMILAITEAPRIDGAILKKSNDVSRYLPIADRTALTSWRPISELHRATLRTILLAPESYWNGWPEYRRFPPKPGFGFVILGKVSTVQILVDLQNPGWEFICNGETYWGFNFVGADLVNLAKEIFPEYASPSRGSVWRKGIIKELERIAESAI